MQQSVATGVLLFSACVMAWVVMFGHVTALVYMDIGLMACALAAIRIQARRPVDAIRLPPRHLLYAFGAWAGWAALSLLWSADPRLSAAGWLDEIGYPFLVFIAFYHLASGPNKGLAAPCGRRASDLPQRATGALHWVEFSWLGASLLLAAMSLVGFHSLPSAQAKSGWLHYYGGVGQASTIPLFVLPIAVLRSVGRETRALGVLGVLCALAIGAATLNRFFYVSAAFVLATAYWPVLRRHWASALGAAAVLGVGAVLMIVHSNNERMPNPSLKVEPVVSIDAALQSILLHDTRPLIWRFYLDKAKAHPLRGIGFGKRLPKRTYSAQAPAWLTVAEPQATTHAHNMFLNTVLEVGLIGLVLQCGLFAMMFCALYQAPGSPWIVSAGAALLVGMITKNLTDDLMWQSTMLAFWAQFGWLLGRAR